jgi:hypothetical protein
MFSSTIQPPLVSLFSSTGSHPLQLFSCGSETSLPSDSFLCFLNDASDRPAPPEPAALIAEPDTRQEHAILPTSDVDVTVLHIQSPTLRSTYIKSPPSGQLGLKLPWFHMQVKNLGREWSFEVGVVDNASREGIIRCSTFQVISISSLKIESSSHAVVRCDFERMNPFCTLQRLLYYTSRYNSRRAWF